MDAAALGIDAAELLRYRTLYFQCDIRAYTADAATASPSLDYFFYRNPAAESYGESLFVFIPDEGRFRFSDPMERAYKVLEAAVSD